MTDKWNTKFESFVGKYICKSCNTQINRCPEKNVKNLQSAATEKVKSTKIVKNKVKDKEKRRMNKNQEVELNDSDSDFESNTQRDPDYVSNEFQKKKLREANQILQEIGNPPLKKMRSGFFLPQEMAKNNDISSERWINDLKTALSNEKTRNGKISLLTTVPIEWSIQRMIEVLDVSRRMASRAKKLHIRCGYGAHPPPKKGRKMEASVLKKVEEFYLSEENSRTMPGKKDYISISKNGKRYQEQKRLLLYNLSELHAKFNETYPEIKISLSTFGQHRPRECILAGQSGTHNVCVCKIHENMRLKFVAIKQELKKRC